MANIIGIILAIAVGVGVAFAGNQDSAQVLGLPIFMLIIIGAYLIQWIVFIIAYIQKSEKYFDLTGSLTYITLTTLAVLLIPNIDRRAALLLVMVIVWATRLGTFLFSRVQMQGKDDRFDEIKVSFTKFLLTWTIQGLWVTFTAAAAFAAITTTNQRDLGWLALVGFIIWAFGYFFELVADVQKSAFKAKPENINSFIHSGLWAWTRHPHVGEKS